MKILAKSVDNVYYLIETQNEKGYIENRETGAKSPEKSIVALLSANIEWKDPDDNEKF